MRCMICHKEAGMNELCGDCMTENIGKKWTIEVPGNPVAQARPRFARIGQGVRAYDTGKVKDYKSYFKTLTAAQKPPVMIDGPMSVSIVVTVLKPKSWSKKRIHADTKPDVDNFAKLICDCLEGLVYTNDSKIVDLHVRKVLGMEPSVEVTVKEATK